MGASKKSPYRKCGDLFINVKSIKNKTKVFTFHCTLCSMTCDQLKKFSQHLENHLEYFQNEKVMAKNQLHSAKIKKEVESKDQINIDDENDFQYQKFIDNNNFNFEPDEVKIEVDLAEKFNDDESGISNKKSYSEYVDPLEMHKFCKTELTVTEDIKNVQKFDTDNEDIDGEKSAKILDNGGQEKVDNSLKLDNSSDSDFDLDKKSNSSKNFKKSKWSVKESDDEESSCNKPEKEKTLIVASILPFLIQEYKKYEMLWQIDHIEYDIKVKKYEIFNKIVESLQAEQNQIISVEDLNHHIKHLNELYTKDKAQELKCEKQGKEFIPEYEHYKDMSFLSQSQGPFACPICNKIIPRFHSYCRHKADHNKTQPYKCTLCDVTFINYNRYLIHKKRHLGVTDFHCKICGKGYMFKGDLEFHVTSHTGDKPYLCSICGTSFRARHGYDNHMRRHEDGFRHQCHICKRGFHQLHALNGHVKSHLNIRDIICNICGKGFVRTAYLRRHEQLHSKEKRYKCKECGKAFFQACGLRSHRKTHALGRAYGKK